MIVKPGSLQLAVLFGVQKSPSNATALVALFNSGTPLISGEWGIELLSLLPSSALPTSGNAIEEDQHCTGARCHCTCSINVTTTRRTPVPINGTKHHCNGLLYHLQRNLSIYVLRPHHLLRWSGSGSVQSANLRSKVWIGAVSGQLASRMLR